MKKIFFLLLCFLGYFITNAQITLPEKIKNKYVYISDFNGDFAPVKDNKCKWGLIDSKGEEILLCRYNKIENIQGILIKVIHNDKTLYWLNQKGKLLPLQYEQVELWQNDLLLVKSGGLWGVVNTQGQGVVLMRYQMLSPAGNYFRVRLDNMEGLLDKTGKDVLKPEYQSVMVWGDNFLVKQNDTYLILSPKKEILSQKYDKIGIFDSSKNYIEVAANGKWGIVNNNGKETLSPSYTDLTWLGGNIFRAYTASGATLINEKGELLTTESISTTALSCGNLLGIKTTANLWLVFDKTTNKKLLPAEYKECVCHEKLGFLQLQDNNRQRGLLSDKGEWLVQPQTFDFKEATTTYSLAVNMQGRWAIVQPEKKINSDPNAFFEDAFLLNTYQYSNALPLSNHYVAVERGTVWSVLYIPTQQVTKSGFWEFGVLKNESILDKNALYFWTKFGTADSPTTVIDAQGRQLFAPALKTEQGAFSYVDYADGIVRLKTNDGKFLFFDLKGNACKCE